MGYYFEETLDLFLESTSAIREISLPYIGVKLSVSKASSGSRQYTLDDGRGDKATFRLKEASSGMKSTIPLAVIVTYMAQIFNFKDAYRRSVLDYLLKSDRLTDFQPATELEGFSPVVSVHIEEPELSLDPESQVMLQSYITEQLFHRALPDRRCKLMYATHSPYLANHLNLLMAQWEHDPTTGVNPEDVDVFLTDSEGRMRSVMVSDEEGRRTVDSEFLSKEIEDIYTEYAILRP